MWVSENGRVPARGIVTVEYEHTNDENGEILIVLLLYPI